VLDQGNTVLWNWPVRSRRDGCRMRNLTLP
jgi:hypothetical protein